MDSFVRNKLADQSLLHDLATHLSDERAARASFLANLAEVDARKLYVPAAYESMHSYCVGELGLSKHAAFKRISVARTAREFPVLLPALAERRLSLSSVLLLTPHLTRQTAEELVAAASNKSKEELRVLLAARFPKPDVPTTLTAIGANGGSVAEPPLQLAPERVGPSETPDAPAQTEPVPTHAKLAPLSPGRFALQFTVGQATHDKLRYAQSLLGHALPSGDIAQVIDRALDALVERLEKQKFAKGARSRSQRGAAKGRHIPAAVKTAVWVRDGGQCTFVSEEGKRCKATKRLEYDHLEAFARGGQATVGGLRLLCRAHNQHAANRTYGAEFMNHKRKAAAELAAQRKAAKAEASARAKDEARAREAAADEKDVVPWLRELGYNLARAQKGAEACAHIPDAPLEERVKVALRALAPRCQHWTPGPA
jgi:5-methylcytosine-specific restriction endonuclease McrA